MATGGEVLGAAGELDAAVASASEAVGDAGAGGAVGGWGADLSRSLAALGEAAARTAGNLNAAAAAYEQTDQSQMRR
jgi:hypothetical protein